MYHLSINNKDGRQFGYRLTFQTKPNVLHHFKAILLERLLWCIKNYGITKIIKSFWCISGIDSSESWLTTLLVPAHVSKPIHLRKTSKGLLLNCTDVVICRLLLVILRPCLLHTIGYHTSSMCLIISSKHKVTSKGGSKTGSWAAAILSHYDVTIMYDDVTMHVPNTMSKNGAK